ncbi:hypothetical protein [Treponema endosymbiont of Eucomonympha sp.]|uniref:hypothetical protein n=1 Tax=Treponema endosymbiont of Eucomonympha sp. TaxID=1580831 RepID=UPI000AF490D3|nr:hypothetical protein [Treponema endosymbiont of Eucomonympha sp.]
MQKKQCSLREKVRVVVISQDGSRREVSPQVGETRERAEAPRMTSEQAKKAADRLERLYKSDAKAGQERFRQAAAKGSGFVPDEANGRLRPAGAWQKPFLGRDA